MRKGFHYFLYAAAALLILSGCGLRGGGLRYNLSPREGESSYRVEIESGEIQTTPEGKEVEVPAPASKRSYTIFFEPTQKRLGKTWLKLNAEMADGSRPVSKGDLGSETIVMDRHGNFEDRYGISLPFETELILPPFPEKIRRGETWIAKRGKKTGNITQPKKWKFKYLGRGKGDRRRCRMIPLNITHTEASDRQMPTGPKVHFKVDYEFEGDICFSDGRVRQADYLELTSLSLSTVGPENIAMQKKDYTRYTIRWEGRTSRKK